jgi:hypothetical protein
MGLRQAKFNRARPFYTGSPPPGAISAGLPPLAPTRGAPEPWRTFARPRDAPNRRYKNYRHNLPVFRVDAMELEAKRAPTVSDALRRRG